MTIIEHDKHKNYTLPQIAGVILAGGESRRMGKLSKPLLALKDQSLLEILIEKVELQVSTSYINLSETLFIQIQSQNGWVSDETENSDIRKLERLSRHIAKQDKTIILDGKYSKHGPLAGILSAMKQARSTSSIEYVLSVPADSPFIPDNLAKTLFNSIQDNQAVYCHSQNRQHYTVALWSKNLLDNIERYLQQGDRSVGRFLKTIKSKAVSFPAERFDPFFNINTPDDFNEAKKINELLP